MEVEVSKIKEKWAEEFDNLTDFSKDNIKSLTIDYVNLDNNILIIVGEAWEEIIEMGKKIFEMNIKHEIIVPPFHFFITKWLEK